jgi:hypothetical protein
MNRPPDEMVGEDGAYYFQPTPGTKLDDAEVGSVRCRAF